MVRRLGDPSRTAPAFSVPNFYGAHGYNPKRSGEQEHDLYRLRSGYSVGKIEGARNIDIAPTVLKLLGEPGADTIECKPLPVLH